MEVFTPDVVFHSPIVYQPYVGRAALAPLLAAILQVFTDFRYLDEYDAPDGKVLQFHARVGERDLDGVDILTFDAGGFVREFTVMVRPYSAATKLAQGNWRRKTRQHRALPKTAPIWQEVAHATPPDDEIHQKLAVIMARAYENVARLAREHKCDIRTAANMLAISRVAEATAMRGIDP
jgi:hypothetical protein